MPLCDKCKKEIADKDKPMTQAQVDAITKKKTLTEGPAKDAPVPSVVDDPQAEIDNIDASLAKAESKVSKKKASKKK